MGDERRSQGDRKPSRTQVWKSSRLFLKRTGAKERARRLLSLHAPGPGYPRGVGGRSIARQREHRECAAKRRIVRERGITADSAETGRADDFCLLRKVLLTRYSVVPGLRIFRLKRPCGQADPRPAADARQHRHILPAAMLVGHDVADDARRSLELIKLLAGLGVDRLQIAFQACRRTPPRQRSRERPPRQRTARDQTRRSCRSCRPRQ